eukprot:GFUD01036260.1.p1 GENE.GFUD01036260.1~~GFUD01036260.1.p1  ORF type:complete len:596 (-),score=216.93 GFUD01036260.1:162-1949(-)
MDLSRIPREELEGLNRGEVESDRKKYWEKFFEKYEQIGAACTTTVGIEEMDLPDVVAGLVRAEKRVKLEMPVSKTFRKWVKEHGDEIDELATIAGPPSVDEEELSDDEDDSDDESNDDSDDLADMIDDTENNPPIPDQSLSLSPPSSPLLSLLDQSDSDSDLLLYSSTLPSSSHSIFAPPSVNLSYKDKLLFSPQLYSSRNNSSAASPTPPHKYLICSSCSKQSLYSTLLGLDQTVFQCDSCMLTDTQKVLDIDSQSWCVSVVKNEIFHSVIGNVDENLGIRLEKVEPLIVTKKCATVLVKAKSDPLPTGHEVRLNVYKKKLGRPEKNINISSKVVIEVLKPVDQDGHTGLETQRNTANNNKRGRPKKKNTDPLFYHPLFHHKLVDNKEEILEENAIEDEANYVEEVQLLEAEEFVELKKEDDDIEIYKEKGQYIPKINYIEVGQTYVSKEEVENQVQLFSDSNFSPLVLHSSSANRKARLSYKCPYGVFKKSTSTGKRKMKQNRYVGCPVIVNFCQRVIGMFVVTKAELEHKGHDVGEEEYFAKIKKKLTEDEKGAVKAFLETKPSNQEVSLLLTDLTGRKYSTRQARDIVKRL